MVSNKYGNGLLLSTITSRSQDLYLFSVSNHESAYGAQDVRDVPTGTSVLVDRCLLQDTTGGYRLHDLVLEYMQLIIKDYRGLAEKAASRQAGYLGRLDVFNGYAAGGFSCSKGGLYLLTALWNSAKKLDGTVDVGACYAESLEDVSDIRIITAVGWLLIALVRFGIRV